MNLKMSKAVFLDRDGVINKNAAEHFYIKSAEELELINEIGEVIALIKDKGYLVIVVSNQQGVGKGLISVEDVNLIHNEINRRLQGNGVAIDAFYWCGHLEIEGCDFRKPKPGLLEKAIIDYEIDKSQSFFIGDRESDKKAGEAAGIKTVLVEKDCSILQVIKGLLENE